MSTILAIETSVPQASIALLSGGQIEQKNFESHRQQNQLLFEPLQELIESLGEHSIDTILVGTGPGSYSGSRIAIAAAQGLATVYGAKVIGICSFYCVPSVDRENTIAIGDARRGSYFHYDLSLSCIDVSPTLCSEQELLDTLAQQQEKAVISLETQNQLPVPQVAIKSSTARCMIEFWQQLTPDLQQGLENRQVEPLYLRAPFITKSTKSHPLLGK